MDIDIAVTISREKRSVPRNRCSSVSSFSKKSSNLFHAGVDRRLNKIEQNYTHDFALPKTYHSVLKKYVEFQDRNHTLCKFFILIVLVEMFETLVSLVDAEARNFAMRFSRSPLSLI